MTDKYSGISMPDKLGDFKRGELFDYEAENHGLGISIAYNTTKVKATIYVYNMGEKFIIDGIDSSVVTNSFNQAQIEIITINNTGNKKIASNIKTNSTYLDIETSLVPVLNAEFIYEEHDTPYLASFYNSQLYLTVVNSNLFKIRITYQIGSDSEIILSINKFLKELSNLIATQYIVKKD